LDDEVEGCDVEKVKTEHNEFEEERASKSPGSVLTFRTLQTST
jgi:hypothetical protein